MRTRLVALLLAVVLGAGGGAAAALLGDDGGGDGGATSYADPLGLGIPKVDLGCTGEPVMVVGFGDNAAALRNEVVNTPHEDLRYLETSRSCATRWTPSSTDDTFDWVVYRPGDATDLCLDRLKKSIHRRDNVTFLVDGIDERAMCLCEVPATEAPVLQKRTPAAVAPRNEVWIGELQDMLITIDAELRPDAEVRLTGRNRVRGKYGEVMAARISAAQQESRLLETGILDAATWNRITAAGCPLYDYR
ncbi:MULTISPECIES: peptidoglycan-binding domain-containing protein [unclassified Nocardioides]|uniref:peptidoglycan-binding domain-containing protein n=1 Tax=unclassified Nocardioides TaxID=2615069 RepID=UPI003014C866